jgi:hypothetical protein
MQGMDGGNNEDSPAMCGAEASIVSKEADTACLACAAPETRDRNCGGDTKGAKCARSRAKNSEARDVREAWSLRMAATRSFISNASPVSRSNKISSAGTAADQHAAQHMFSLTSQSPAVRCCQGRGGFAVVARPFGLTRSCNSHTFQMKAAGA